MIVPISEMAPIAKRELDAINGVLSARWGGDDADYWLEIYHRTARCCNTFMREFSTYVDAEYQGETPPLSLYAMVEIVSSCYRILFYATRNIERLGAKPPAMSIGPNPTSR